MDKKVGFIGLGMMGMPIATHLAQSGLDVTVYNRTRGKASMLAEQQKVKIANSPKEAAKDADFVITMVADTPDVEAVAVGKDGIVEGVKPGAVYIDMSSISPRATREIAAKIKAKGADMLDAPVSGGPAVAIQGGLAIMVGGDEAVFNKARPMLDVMGKRVIYMGPQGMGQTTKLMNQIMVVCNVASMCEGIIFAAKAGIPSIAKAIEVLGGGVANSAHLQQNGLRIINGDMSPIFKMELQVKDLRLILEAANEMHLPLPVTFLVNNLFQAAMAKGYGSLGNHALIKVYEELANVEAREKKS
jgi:3-hydroxyisobutyrate dehydrogenase-like beta-hydroxyacid dehydrogenase